MFRVSNVLLLVTLSCTVCFSQQQRTFFDKSDRLTDEAHSLYYKLTEPFTGQDSIVRTFYTKSGKKRSLQVFQKGKPVRGAYREWYANAKIKIMDSVDLDNKYVWYMYYATGKPQEITIHPNTGNHSEMVISYWDSLGNQLVKEGNGVCKCYYGGYNTVRREEGKLIAGNKDGKWNTYLNDTLARTSEYADGKLIQGMTIKDGVPYQYTEIEVPPKYVGGVENLKRFLAKNLIYPKIARRNNIEGRVFVGFIVEKDGTISNEYIVKGISPECDAESLRLVKEMPKWSPGYQWGVPVRIKFVVPISFRLSD